MHNYFTRSHLMAVPNSHPPPSIGVIFGCHISSHFLLHSMHIQRNKNIIKMINIIGALVLLFAFLFLSCVYAQDTTTLVPAIITFGDSAVDVGNNDYLPTLFKADYPPYGRDFANHQPTGRFCNGKLATDFTGKTNLNHQISNL